MRQVTVGTVISAPRERVFDYVADISLRPSYCDHYLKDFRLARVNPVGVGAAASFLLDAPVFSDRGEIAIVVTNRPRQIAEEGRVGRRGRSRTVAIYDFIREGPQTTRVELTTFSDPTTFVDRFKQRRAHRWVRRQTKKSLERLRRIFEEPQGAEPVRASVAAWEGATAPRFGGRVTGREKAASGER